MSALDYALKLLEDDGAKSSVWHPKAVAVKALVAQVQAEAREELELLRENAFSLAHAMLTRDIGVCTSCGIPLSGVHSHREQTGCSCTNQALPKEELARLRRCEEMIPVYQRALQKIYDTTSDNLSAAIAEGVLSPKYVEESDSRCTPRLAEREGGGG